MQSVTDPNPATLPSDLNGVDNPTSQAQKPWRTPHLSMLKLEETHAKNPSSFETASSGAS